MSIRGVGIDLVAVERLRQVIARWADRFLARVFTPAEIAYCRRRRDPVPHFAARFAAKEAALKALGTGLRMGIRWTEIEVRRDPGQPPEVHLSGRALELGRLRGGERVLVSLAHDGGFALAQALLVTRDDDARPAGALR